MVKSKTSASTLDSKSLQHFKDLLIAKRQNAEKQLRMTTENIQILDSDNDPDFMPASDIPEAGSDTQSDTLNYQLSERTRKYIKQIDEALIRIENGTYGICQATGKPISRARLEAVPHTRFSIDAKRHGNDEE
jgi:RNA polymerase-binding protein DksA